MKLFNILFTIIFLCFAVLQLNDPDPYLWIPIYGSMAAICMVSVFLKISNTIYKSMALIFTVYALALLPSVITWFRSDDRSELFNELAKMRSLYIEEAREFFGLMICLSVLGINYLKKNVKRL